MMHYCQKVLEILLLFICPIIPLSVLFSHFSGLFPVPYRLCIVYLSNVEINKCYQILRQLGKFVIFLIKIHSKSFGSRLVFVLLSLLDLCYKLFINSFRQKNLDLLFYVTFSNIMASSLHWR